MPKTKISSDWLLIIGLAFFKLALHFLTNTNYELHRDAYLYLALGDHLDFGYISVPPSIAVVAKFTRLLFGDSVFAIRLFPALVGAASVVLVGLIVRNFGGKKWAILLAGSAFIVSPAFLRSNTLFQPVAFNQFYWLLTAYFMVKLIQTKNPKFWLHLGVVWGLAFLNKYAIAFLVLAFLISLLFTPNRKLFQSKYFLLGLSVGFIIILPNLIWQFNHNWPVVAHMAELQRTQLIHVNIPDFLIMQLLMNLPAILIWLFGLAFLLFFKQGEKYRVLAYTYLAVLLILIMLRGKPYYTLGLYPMLFAAGGFAIEKYFVGRLRFFRHAILATMVLISIPAIPYSLPVLPPNKMVKYAASTKKFGLEGALRWEDGRIHSLPQDYADMVGWKELSQIVIETYNRLSETDRNHGAIYAENYGQAGAIKYYGKKYGLPEPISFNASFLFWAPDSLDIMHDSSTPRLHNLSRSSGIDRFSRLSQERSKAQHAGLSALIYINDEAEDISYYFAEVKQVGQITNVYARESGLPVYLCRRPRNGFEDFYKEKVRNLKDHYR